MAIRKVRIQNYRCIRNLTMNFRKDLNIIVGDNDVGKSTVLEAINLALTGQLRGKSIYSERHQYLFNTDLVAEYLEKKRGGSKDLPPSLEIEVYFFDDDDNQELRGANNSLREDSIGIKFSLEFDKQHWEDFEEYFTEHGEMAEVPIDYFKIFWRSFAEDDVNARIIQKKSAYIDAADIKSLGGASKFILEMMGEKFDRKERLHLSVAYKAMREKFSSQEGFKKLNGLIAEIKGGLTDRSLGIALDSSSRLYWENVVEMH
ncbi:MAG: DUF2813 domain-containing protein [Proteobacteria bacterium]|nr:MAG: DUF2813 domain-containing protein [Pseudomonadota bacterium]